MGRPSETTIAELLAAPRFRKEHGTHTAKGQQNGRSVPGFAFRPQALSTALHNTGSHPFHRNTGLLSPVCIALFWALRVSRSIDNADAPKMSRPWGRGS